MVRIASILSAILLIAAGFWGWVSYSKSHEADEVTVTRIRSVSGRPSARLGTERDSGEAQAIARLGADRSDEARRLTAGVSTFDPDSEYEEGELVVVNPPANFEADAGQLGFSVLETLNLRTLSLTILRLRIPQNMNVPDARRVLTARFPGTLIDANHRYDPSAERRPRLTASAQRTERDASRTAIMSRARAAIGWINVPASCGKGVRIGMVDSAIDLTHPALAGQNIEYRSFNNPKRRPAPPIHGTSVAALLVGKPSAKGWGGLLPGAELIAANMFEVSETGRNVGNVVALLKSLEWLATKKVHAVNLSIAGSDNTVVRKTIDHARKQGMVLIAAAGNWGRADRPAYPAAYHDVVAVTAVGAYRGVYKYANQGEYIDFAAPGVRLWTAVPGGGRYQSGTSFAAPYLTAIIAMEIANGGSKDPDRLRSVISAAAADLGAPGKDSVYGWGFVEKQPHCRH